MKPNAPNPLNQFDRATVNRPPNAGAIRGPQGGELRPHHLRHPPETRQWVARSQLIAAVFTKKKGCRLGRGSPRFKMPPTIGGKGTGAGGVIITRLGRHRSSAAQVPYVALGKQLAHRGC